MERITVVEQPCILCEQTLCIDTLYRDEQGKESWDREYMADSHLCGPLKRLMKERTYSR